MDTKRFPRAWSDESELALVRDNFYPRHAPTDPFATPPGDGRQEAVNMVSIFLLRNPTTPHAMVATANLTEALIHDDRPDRRPQHQVVRTEMIKTPPPYRVSVIHTFHVSCTQFINTT